MLTIQSLLKSDKHLIYPYNITSESNVTVKRIKEMISNWKSSWLFYKFSSSVPLEMSRKQCWGICTLILECREWMDRTLYCDRASLSFHRYKWVQQTARGKRFWDKICKWLAIWLETCNPLLGGFNMSKLQIKFALWVKRNCFLFFFNIGAKNNIPFNLAASFAVFTVCFKIYW